MTRFYISRAILPRTSFALGSAPWGGGVVRLTPFKIQKNPSHIPPHSVGKQDTQKEFLRTRPHSHPVPTSSCPFLGRGKYPRATKKILFAATNGGSILIRPFSFARSVPLSARCWRARLLHNSRSMDMPRRSFSSLGTLQTYALLRRQCRRRPDGHAWRDPAVARRDGAGTSTLMKLSTRRSTRRGHDPLNVESVDDRQSLQRRALGIAGVPAFLLSKH